MARKIIVISKETLQDQDDRWDQFKSHLPTQDKIDQFDKYIDVATGKTILRPKISPDIDWSNVKLPTVNVGTTDKTDNLVRNATYIGGGVIGLAALGYLISVLKK